MLWKILAGSFAIAYLLGFLILLGVIATFHYLITLASLPVYPFSGSHGP